MDVSFQRKDFLTRVDTILEELNCPGKLKGLLRRCLLRIMAETMVTLCPYNVSEAY